MEGVKRRRMKFPCLFGGKEESLKRRTVQSWSPAPGNSTSDPSLFKFEVGKSNSKQHNVKPMKRLSAKGISNESSAKKQSTCILAKLMGRDRLSSARPIHKQETRLLDNCSKSTASPGAQRNENPFNHQSDKRRTMEQQHIKAVYEDPEASHAANQHRSLQLCAKMKLQIKELRDMQENPDSMLLGSNKIESKHEMTDSNSDLMLNFLQQPDPMFVKHLHYSQSTPSSSFCNHIANLKPSNSVRHTAYHKGWKEEEDASTYRDPFAHQGNGDEILNLSSHSTHHSHKSSTIKLEGKEVCGSDIPSKKIVVQKPNTSKAKNVYHSFDDCMKNTECFSSVIDEGDSWKDEGSPSEVRFSEPKCIDARETTKEMIGGMKESFESRHVNLSEYDSRGYFVDESFHVYRSVSARETGATTMPFRITFDRNDRLTSSLSNLSEPSLIREANNRLFERLEMTHRQEDVGMFSKGSMLGEMLSFPSKEMKTAELDRVICLVSDNDEYLTNTSRSTSLLPPFHDPNHKMSVYHEADADEKVVVYSDPLNQGRRKALEGIFNHGEGIPSKKERYNKRCQTSQCSNTASTEFCIHLSESQSSHTSTETYLVKEGPAEYQPLISEIDNGATNAASLVDPMAGYANEMSSGTSNNKKLTLELASCIVGGTNSSWIDENNSNFQEPLTAKSGGTDSIQLSGPESEYSESLKEVDHLSRFSILEVPPPSDISSDSDCFERLDSQLQELKNQLHLLKMESQSTSNGLTLARYANQRHQQPSVVAAPELVSWESSFLEHILQSSDIYDTNTAPWYTIHHPTDPRLYYRIEKHYFEGATMSRSEKHLFYDYIEEMFISVSNFRSRSLRIWALHD